MDYRITSGPAIKALGGGRFAGYLVTWGNEATKDADGEWFTPATDFDTEFPARTSVYWHHGQDPAVGRQRLTHAQMDRDDFGIRVEGQLDIRNAKQAAIYRRVEAGEVGLSSGSLGHVTVPPRESPGGPIHQWPGIGHDCSLTPIPSDRRNIAFAVKSIPLPPVEELAADDLPPSLAEDLDRVADYTEAVRLRCAGIKAGTYQFSQSRRERIARLRDELSALLDETDPGRREPKPDTPTTPDPGPGEEEPAAGAMPAMAVPDMHDIFANLLAREDSGLTAIGSY